jgi:hypothetical protein
MPPQPPKARVAPSADAKSAVRLNPNMAAMCPKIPLKRP